MKRFIIVIVAFILACVIGICAYNYINSNSEAITEAILTNTNDNAIVQGE